MARLSQLRRGMLTIVDHEAETTWGADSPNELCGSIRVVNPRFYRSMVTGGSLGAAESYIRGDWQTPDLTTVLRIIARNSQALAEIEKGSSRLLRAVRFLFHSLQRNSRAGSKRNIAAHYDLSNEFFSLMLDPTMTYSSGIFATAESTLEEASIAKYDRICRRLNLGADDHVLEIGTGWGGFAEYAATTYGCRVTTTTISAEQFAYATGRLAPLVQSGRVSLLNQDYRDLSGSFDKLVSIEMIEAVGEKYLNSFFAKCSELLTPDGSMMLQAITIPDDRYGRYRKSVDFIQRYIFPGGFVPSLGAISQAVGQSSDFRFFHLADFAGHYANTLRAWRYRFWKHIDEVMSLGFDERFVRTWDYYLCYCEAGFSERQIGVSQIQLHKPECRLEPNLAN